MRWFATALMLALMVLPARAEPLTVFAAASLKNAFDEIGAAFTEETGIEVVFSYAGTSALARQIEQGAPADVFAAAHPMWIDYLDDGQMIRPETRLVFANNRLVLISPFSPVVESLFDLTSADDLLALLGEDGRLAVALVDAVPAGIYAREALEALGVWEALEPRLAQADNVRSAMFLVARGEAPLGIVYASDAVVEPRVSVVSRISYQRQRAIVYQAVATSDGAHPNATLFLEFLLGPVARQILSDNGLLNLSCPIIPMPGRCDGGN